MNYDKQGYSTWKPNSPNSRDSHPYIAALESVAERYQNEYWNLDEISVEEFRAINNAIAQSNALIKPEGKFSEKDFDTLYKNQLTALRDYYYNYLPFKNGKLINKL